MLTMYNTSSFCTGSILDVFGLLGIVVTIIKVAIPIILIIMGMLDMGKAVTAGKDDEIKKQLKIFLIRAIAAILVFFIPAIVGVIMQTVNTTFAGQDLEACGYDACIAKVTGVHGKCTK